MRAYYGLLCLLLCSHLWHVQMPKSQLVNPQLFIQNHTNGWKCLTPNPTSTEFEVLTGNPPRYRVHSMSRARNLGL
ncbi:hypothetical protein DFH08DRAFT_900386, partial [Mycena albidolilacea]